MRHFEIRVIEDGKLMWTSTVECDSTVEAMRAAKGLLETETEIAYVRDSAGSPFQRPIEVRHETSPRNWEN